MHINRLSFLIQCRVTASLLPDDNIAFGLTFSALTIASFTIFASVQVVQLLLCFFNFALFLNCLARFSNTHVAIGFEHGVWAALLSCAFKLRGFVILIDYAFLFHAGLIIATITLLILIQVVILIIKVH